MRDLTYHDDGLKNEDGRINTKKVHGIYSIVCLLQMFQATPYVKDLEKFDLNLEHHLRTLPGRLSPEQCSEVSRQREPKNATRADIV